MFALLEHKTPDGNVHWDFLLEVAGQERLATWRLADNPLTASGDIAAEKLPDHRRIYLEYEGPLTQNRGKVRRLDRGNAEVHAFTDENALAELAGEKLRGQATLRTSDSGMWTFIFNPTSRQKLRT